MPDFQDVKSKLSAHMHVTTQALDAFQARGLLDMVAKEQNLATGIKGDEPPNMRGAQPQLKLADAERAVEQFVASPAVLMEDKVRLVLLFASTQRVFTQEHSARFLQAAQEYAAPQVVLEATHIRATDIVPLELLRAHAVERDR